MGNFWIVPIFFSSIEILTPNGQFLDCASIFELNRNINSKWAIFWIVPIFLSSIEILTPNGQFLDCASIFELNRNINSEWAIFGLCQYF